jgi:hypothetical protein
METRVKMELRSGNPDFLPSGSKGIVCKAPPPTGVRTPDNRTDFRLRLP